MTTSPVLLILKVSSLVITLSYGDETYVQTLCVIIITFK